jgi:hypothetical protein
MKKYVEIGLALSALAVLSAHGVTNTIQIGGAGTLDFQWYDGVANTNVSPTEYAYTYDMSVKYPDLNGLVITVTAVETNDAFITYKGVYTGGTNGNPDRLDVDEAIVLSVSYEDPNNYLRGLRVKNIGGYYCGDAETLIFTVGNTTTNVSGISSGQEFDYDVTGLTPLTKATVSDWSLMVTAGADVVDLEAGVTNKSEVALGVFELEYIAGPDDIEVLVPVTFDFNDGNTLDGQGIGGAMTSSVVVLTIKDIMGQDGSLASEGAGHMMWSDSQNCLGINDVSNSLAIAANQERDINPGEGWVFSFNTNVYLDEIDFAGWTSESEVTLSCSVFTNFVMSGDVSGDTFYPLTTFIPAGTDITMQMTWTSLTNGDSAVRMPYLIVTPLPNSLDPNSYAYWKSRKALTEGINDGYDDDPDEDKMKNLVEFALGADPMAADAESFLPVCSFESEGGTNYFCYVYRRLVNWKAQGLVYTVGSSESLTRNLLASPTDETGAANLDGAYEMVTNRVPMTGTTVQFIGLEITAEE